MAKGSGATQGKWTMAGGAGNRRRVYEAGGLKYVKEQYQSDRVVVYASVPKLDKGWRESEPTFYIPPGGGGAEIKGRRAGFREFLAKDKPIEMPRVSYSKIKGRRVTGFGNGRHRFSVLRDMGKQVIPVQVYKSEAEEFRRRYGVDRRKRK